MKNYFVVPPKRQEKKEDQSVIMTIRINREIQEQYEELATKSNHSRNGMMWIGLS